MITRKFTYDNVTCEYHILGQGRPLIFFHGGGITPKSYSKLLDILSKRYQVYAPHIPCFGNSSTPNKKWNFIDYGKYFSQFIDDLQLTDTILIGHSFGGGVALHTSTQSTKISKLILIDPAGATMQHSKFTLYRAIIGKPLQQFIRNNKIITLNISLDSIQNYIIKHFKNLVTHTRIVNHCIYFNYQIPTTFNTSTLILWGQDDQIFQGITYAAWFKQQISNSITKLIKGDHDWVIFEPELLMRELN